MPSIRGKIILSPKIKYTIVQFKLEYHRVTLLALFKRLSELHKEVQLSDVKRWMETHLWIREADLAKERPPWYLRLLERHRGRRQLQNSTRVTFTPKKRKMPSPPTHIDMKRQKLTSTKSTPRKIMLNRSTCRNALDSSAQNAQERNKGNNVRIDPSNSANAAALHIQKSAADRLNSENAAVLPNQRSTADHPNSANAAVLHIQRNATDPPNPANAAALPIQRSAADPPNSANAVALPIQRNATDPPNPANAAALPIQRSATDPPNPANAAALPIQRRPADPPNSANAAVQCNLTRNVTMNPLQPVVPAQVALPSTQTNSASTSNATVAAANSSHPQNPPATDNENGSILSRHFRILNHIMDLRLMLNSTEAMRPLMYSLEPICRAVTRSLRQTICPEDNVEVRQLENADLALAAANAVNLPRSNMPSESCSTNAANSSSHPIANNSDILESDVQAQPIPPANNPPRTDNERGDYLTRYYRMLNHVHDMRVLLNVTGNLRQVVTSLDFICRALIRTVENIIFPRGNTGG